MKLLSPPVAILAAAALLALTLVGVVLREGTARAGGQEVVLEIAGYDPRSLLSGHYVQFQIASERAAGASCPSGVSPLLPSRESWIALRQAGQRHEPVGQAGSREEALRLGPVAVRGSTECRMLDERTSVVLDLGIDRFYADQAQAEAIQRRIAAATGPGAAFAVVSVGRDGRARLTGLIVGGKRTDLGWF